MADLKELDGIDLFILGGITLFAFFTPVMAWHLFLIFWTYGLCNLWIRKLAGPGESKGRTFACWVGALGMAWAIGSMMEAIAGWFK